MALGGYLTYKLGKWLYQRMAYGDEPEKEIPLSPFPIKQPVVYHFHPVAFVEQMRRMGDIWHEPVLNPQLNKYTFGGNINPSNGVYGHVRKWRTKIPSHTGIDIFALPGTEVYACLDGVVVDTSTSAKAKGYNKTVRIKVNNTMEFIDQLNFVNYSLQFEKEGEMMGVTPKKNDDIYLIYMHLSEFKCNRGDIVNKGDIIALSGVTGNASGTRGPHLHFEIATVLYPYGEEKRKLRINPARAVDLQSYNTLEQDNSSQYIYLKDGTKEKFETKK